MLGQPFKALLDGVVGASAVGMVRGVKLMDRRRTADFSGAVMRKVGPLFKESYEPGEMQPERNFNLLSPN